MIKMFNKLNYKHSIWEVYTDFLEIAALSINTAAQIQNKEKNDTHNSIFKNMNQYEHMI